MAFVHGKDTKVYVNGYDLTAFFKSSSVEGTAEAAETSTFGVTAKTFIAGLKDATLSLEGLFDGVANAIDEVLQAALGVASSIWTVLLEGDVIGKRGYGFDAIETNYSVESPVDDVVGVAAEAQSKVGLESVLVSHPLAAETVLGSSASIDNAAASTNGGVGYLQVSAFSGWDSVDIVVEDSADDSVFATVLTFANVTAARAKERIAITGTVRQYTQTTWTFNGVGPGTSTFSVVFGRK